MGYVQDERYIAGYVQDERYIAGEHMDVRRDCVNFARLVNYCATRLRKFCTACCRRVGNLLPTLFPRPEPEGA